MRLMPVGGCRVRAATDQHRDKIRLAARAALNTARMRIARKVGERTRGRIDDMGTELRGDEDHRGNPCRGDQPGTRGTRRKAFGAHVHSAPFAQAVDERIGQRVQTAIAGALQRARFPQALLGDRLKAD